MLVYLYVSLLHHSSIVHLNLVQIGLLMPEPKDAVYGSFLNGRNVLLPYYSYHIAGGDAKVDSYSRDGEQVPHFIVFMDPAAELLKDARAMFELLCQRHHQQN